MEKVLCIIPLGKHNTREGIEDILGGLWKALEPGQPARIMECRTKQTPKGPVLVKKGGKRSWCIVVEGVQEDPKTQEPLVTGKLNFMFLLHSNMDTAVWRYDYPPPESMQPDEKTK